MSKYQLKKSSIYYDDSNIPVNKLEIKDGAILHHLEEDLLQDAFEIYVSELNDNTCFDEAYFKSLHLRTFTSLYSITVLSLLKNILMLLFPVFSMQTVVLWKP